MHVNAIDITWKSPLRNPYFFSVMVLVNSQNEKVFS